MTGAREPAVQIIGENRAMNAIPRAKRLSHGLGASMAGGNPNPTRGRSENDFYATPDDVTDSLLARWGHHVSGVVWEPCGGSGKMAARLARHQWSGTTPVKVIATDAHPRPDSELVHPVSKLDLFDLKARDDGKRRFKGIITNPPFDIAADIIEHVLTVAEPDVQTFALLLKSTFWHAAKRQGLFRAFPPSLILPLTWRPDFLNLKAPTMEVSWNVWINGNSTTIYQPLERAK